VESCDNVRGRMFTPDRQADQSRVHLRGERFCFRTGLAALPPFCRSTVSRAPGSCQHPDLTQNRTSSAVKASAF
jgi:hypothetical protein